MELFDIGLESVVETSPDFDKSPIEPKKIRKRKAATKKERERVLKKIHQLPLSKITTFCLDTTRSKLTEHTIFKVRDFSLELEPDDIYFIVTFLKNTRMFASLYENCVQKKDKYITFQFQWHQRCSFLLVTVNLDLTKLSAIVDAASQR